MYRIAVIEDIEPTNNEFKGFLLRIWPDCIVHQYMDCDSALQGVEEIKFDLIISDIDLGEGSNKHGGAKIAKAIHGREIPLLIVSGAPEPELYRNLFKALDAWDYLQKPVVEADFSTQVRRAITYKSSQPSTQSESRQDLDSRLIINTANKAAVTWIGKRVSLTITQIRLLQLIAKNGGENTTFEQLFSCIESGQNKDNLRVHIGQIRNAFKEVDTDFNCIQTVPMVGYRWNSQ